MKTNEGVQGQDPNADKTIYELPKLIERCFDEAIKAGYVTIGVEQADCPGPDDLVYIVKNRQELVRHISHTIIGELFELDLVRKLQPIIRALPGVTRDFAFLDSRLGDESRKMSLRMKDHIDPTLENQKQ